MILQLTRPNSINLKTKNLRQQPLRCRELGKMGLFVTLGALPSHQCGNLSWFDAAGGCVRWKESVKLSWTMGSWTWWQSSFLDWTFFILFHPFPTGWWRLVTKKRMVNYPLFFLFLPIGKWWQMDTNGIGKYRQCHLGDGLWFTTSVQNWLLKNLWGFGFWKRCMCHRKNLQALPGRLESRRLRLDWLVAQEVLTSTQMRKRKEGHGHIVPIASIASIAL